MSIQEQSNLLKANLNTLEELPQGMSSWTVPLNFNNQYFLKVKPAGSITYETLRNMSRFYDIARTCITIKQNQITQLDWNIVSSDESKNYDEEIKLRKQWVKSMGGGLKFSKVLKKWIEDICVVDGLANYKRKTFGGALLGITQVDPATIKLRVDDSGLTPPPPEIAYEQWIRGSKVADLTTMDMNYHISNPRTDSPYGFSILESLLITVESSLKLGMYNLSYFTDGTMPEGFYELPAEWNLNQIKAYQEWWDTMMSGDPRNMRKIRFMPAASGGKGFTPAKNFDFASVQPFMEWLMKITCSAFGVMPQELGFTANVNRSSSEEQTEIAKRNSIKAVAFEIEELMDELMENDLIMPNGQIIKPNPDLHFNFMDLDPKDELIDSQVTDMNLRNGLISINAWRKDHGEPAIEGADDPYIMTSGGPVWLSDFIASKGTTFTNAEPITEPVKTVVEEPKTTPKEELKLWEKKALNDIKEGKKFRKFDSNVLDDYILARLPEDLHKCTTKIEVKECFSKWQEVLVSGVNKDLKKLYEKLDELVAS